MDEKADIDPAGSARNCARTGISSSISTWRTTKRAAASLYDRRYRPAFVRYEKEAGPVENADLVIRF